MDHAARRGLPPRHVLKWDEGDGEIFTSRRVGSKRSVAHQHELFPPHDNAKKPRILLRGFSRV